MRIFPIALAALSLALALDAQNVTLRVTGSVSSNSFTSAPYAGISIGTISSLEAEFQGPTSILVPNQSVEYSLIPGTLTTSIGAISQSSTATPTLAVQDSFGGGDGLTLADHALGSGATQSFSLLDASGSLWSSVNLSALLGTYTPGAGMQVAWSVDQTPGAGTMLFDVLTVELLPAMTCPLATATFRNDPGNVNPPVFLATPPVQGGVMSLQVTNAPGPLTFTAVSARPMPLNVPTGFGVVLVNIGQGELLGLPPRPGPTGTWSVPVPTTPSLCGATFSIQGFGLGPGQLVLYNAWDMVVGS